MGRINDSQLKFQPPSIWASNFFTCLVLFCSYAARESPEYNPYRKSSSKSRSRSTSPVNTGQITYITSFGGEEEAHGSSSQVTSSSSKRVNYSHLRRKKSNSPLFSDRTSSRRISKSRSRSRSRSITRNRSYRSRDRRRSLSRNR